MKQKLIIELSEEATENYFKWLEPINQHSADTNSMPGGISLQLDILPGIVETVYGKDNDGLTELGDINVSLVDV